MTASVPAFTCRCIQEAEEDTDGAGPEWCGEILDNHISEFGWDAWRRWATGLAGPVMHEHYEAHARGAPHNHIPRPRVVGNNGTMILDTKDRFGSCSCHHYDITDRDTSFHYQAASKPLVDVALSGPGLPSVVDRHGQLRPIVNSYYKQEADE